MKNVTKAGIYLHHKGGKYRVLGGATISTNGNEEGKNVVVYISLTTGRMHVRDEREFHEELRVPSDGGFSFTKRFKIVEST